MQSKTLYGAKGRAAVGALVPGVVSVVILANLLDGGRLGAFAVLIIAIFGYVVISKAAEVFRPKRIEMDRYGFAYFPALGIPSGKIRWSDVDRFEIKGGSKDRQIVCFHREGDGHGLKKLKLGRDWASTPQDLWGMGLDEAQELLSKQRREALAAGVQSKPLREVETPQRAPVVDDRAKPVVQAKTAELTRSGVVYAETHKAVVPSRTVSLNGERGSSGLFGWVLFAGGMATAGLSLVPFIPLCKQGLCSADIWDFSDYRIWAFATLWTLCLLAVLVGANVIWNPPSSRAPRL